MGALATTCSLQEARILDCIPPSFLFLLACPFGQVVHLPHRSHCNQVVQAHYLFHSFLADLVDPCDQEVHHSSMEHLAFFVDFDLNRCMNKTIHTTRSSKASQSIHNTHYLPNKTTPPSPRLTNPGSTHNRSVEMMAFGIWVHRVIVLFPTI